MVRNNTKLLLKLSIIPIVILLGSGIAVYYYFNSKNLRDIEIRKDQVNLVVGESYRVEYTLVPSTAENIELLWITDNESVIHLENETITATKMGDANVWISSKANPALKKRIQVNVLTKRARFKKRIVSEYGYRTMDNNYYITDEGYKFDFNNNLFYSERGSTAYNYFYKDGIIEYKVEDGSKIVFYVDSYTWDCYTSRENWCDSQEKTANEMKLLAEQLKIYLGDDTTVDDL